MSTVDVPFCARDVPVVVRAASVVELVDLRADEFGEFVDEHGVFEQRVQVDASRPAGVEAQGARYVEFYLAGRVLASKLAVEHVGVADAGAHFLEVGVERVNPHLGIEFLLPEGVTVGSRLKLENFQWELLPE